MSDASNELGADVGDAIDETTTRTSTDRRGTITRP